MSDYRLYFVNEQGHFTRVQELQAASDEDAAAQAEDAASGERAELWDRDRIVARVDAVLRRA